MQKKSLGNRIFSTLEFRFWGYRVSWFKTLYFNLRSLPFKKAIKLPVYIHTHTQFGCLSGSVEINGVVRRGMVHIGKRTDRGQGVTIIKNMGTIRLGDQVMIFQGCDFLVGPNGVLNIEDKVRIRENVLIYVSKYVSIGERTGIAYQSTISEDDYHYLIDMENGTVKNSLESIIIGKNNWIGSRTVIKKGTVTPDNIVVASSYSLLGKDYRDSVPEYSVIGGVPAKLLRKNIRRIYSNKTSAMIDDHYSKNDSVFHVNLDDIDMDEFCLD